MCRRIVFFLLILVSALPATATIARLVPTTPTAPRGAVAASADARVGLNLEDLAYNGNGAIFVDAMKQAAPWTSARSLRLDVNGNVVALVPGQMAQTVIYPSGWYPAGDYTLLYDGTGRFAIAPASGAILSQNRGRVVMRITPQVGFYEKAGIVK